ncbi:MAG: preprotein translocase subunit SecY, partial [Candidatus Latescibacteria bacterium]|nr:preprotein translocase subunit SecY [Candidatus Latescibacterota bacterium]
DLFTGRSMSRMTIFALGIMPYISASIILQLLQVVWPYLERLSKEGEMGRKKITQYTRYGTLFICMIQSGGIAFLLKNLRSPVSNSPIVPNGGIGFILMTMLTLTTGTVFIMWLGEQITDRGIGNGISMIIYIGIIAMFPQAVIDEVRQVAADNKTLIELVLTFGLMYVVTMAAVLLTQGVRKIPVQYAKRVVGRKVYGGQSTHIPLRINTAGVIPIIFAQALMFIPQTALTFFPENQFFYTLQSWFTFNSPIYWFFYSILIIFFAFFYTAVVFNPVDLAENMKKYGGFIPGIRPGKKTAEYVERVLGRVTFPGAVGLAALAVLPYMLVRYFNLSVSMTDFFGGTGLLIIVGVALDTLQQIESHLMMRHYEGFTRSGKIRGRVGRG